MIMFSPQRWAGAFIHTMGNDCEEAFAILKILNEWAKKLPGDISGTANAMQAEKAVRKAAEHLGIKDSRPVEGALRFLVLIIRKGNLRYCDKIINEIDRQLDANKKTFTVILEYVFPPGKELEEQICETVKKRIGAAEVRIVKKPEPSLIGGFRLRIGDEVIDASVLSQLRKMEADLALDPGVGLSNGAA